MLTTRLKLGLLGRDRVCEVLVDALLVYMGVRGPKSDAVGTKMAQHRLFQLFVKTGETPLIHISENSLGPCEAKHQVSRWESIPSHLIRPKPIELGRTHDCISPMAYDSRAAVGTWLSRWTCSRRAQ